MTDPVTVYQILGATANLIKILQTVASVLRKFGRENQAEALERTVEELRNGKEPTPEDVKATLEKNLSEEESEQVMDIIAILQEIFPILPKNRIQGSYFKLKELITVASEALERFDTFRFYGQRENIFHRLEIQTFSARFIETAQTELKKLFPNISGGHWKGFLYTIRSGHQYLSDVPFCLNHSSTNDAVFLMFREHSPYSVFLVGQKGQRAEGAPKGLVDVLPQDEGVEKRLDLSIEYLKDGLMYDVKSYIERISRESNRRREEAERIEKAISALRQISST